jgi:hypothetical protein
VKKLIKSENYKDFIILIIQKNNIYYAVIRHQLHKTQLFLCSSITKEIRCWNSDVEVLLATQKHIDFYGSEMLRQIELHELYGLRAVN